MTVFPVIVRELRASARQPFTYNLRLLGVAALLLATVLFSTFVGLEPGRGRLLFSALHCTLFGAIWVLVPMLTADCLSRERREGTLGLLFMTPLNGTDIVVAKSLAQGLRAVTLWLAVLPVMTICFLLGGVSWAEAALSVVINADVMCWALAAGLLASAWSKSWLRALLLAVMLALAFHMLLNAVAGGLMWKAVRFRWQYSQLGLSGVAMGLGLLTNGGGRGYIDFWGRGGGWQAGLGRGGEAFWVLAQTSVLSLLALAIAMLIAGARLRRCWREEPPSARQVWLQKTFCTPVLWLSFFSRWMRRKLERNPIGWLEQRTWSGRLVTWGWLAVLVSIYSTFFTTRSWYDGNHEVHEFLALLLVVSMAASAAGSFRRERESGVLELLLVSPLQERHIIQGRLKGLWSQFAPAAGLILLVWAYTSLTFKTRYGNAAGAVVFFLSTLLTLPVFGLYYSLCCRNFLTALLSTLGVGLLLPLALIELVGSRLKAATPWRPWQDQPFWETRVALAGLACQLVLGAFWWYRLGRRLRKRTFPLERPQVA